MLLERKIDGKPAKFSIDVESILKGEQPDLELDAGDLLLVLERIF